MKILAIALLFAQTDVAATATASPTETAEARATPTATAEATPAPLAKPVLFRGTCTPGGGASGCRVFAVGFVTDAGIEAFPCTTAIENESRNRIAARYFRPGTELDLYLRGAPTGVFTVVKEDEPSRGCGNRAEGRRRGAPGHTYSFIALHPEDPVKLAAVRYPMGVQPPPQAIAVAALAGEISGGATASDIKVRDHRRLRDGDTSILVIEAVAGSMNALVIAEGDGPDASKWKIVWKDLASSGKANLEIADSFDLGADGTPEILFERVHRGEPSEWVLLRRSAGAWK